MISATTLWLILALTSQTTLAATPNQFTLS